MNHIAIIAAVLGAAILTAGCTSENLNAGSIIKCSDYREIVDKYQTPGPCDSGQLYDRCLYVAFKNGGRQEVFNGTYQNIIVGQFMDNEVFFSHHFNMTRLNESETGLRDACQVIP